MLDAASPNTLNARSSFCRREVIRLPILALPFAEGCGLTWAYAARVTARRTRQRERARDSNRKPAAERSSAHVWLSVLLFAGSLALYWPSRSSEFVWDDQPYHLAGNTQLMRGDYAAFWARPYRDFYIPVMYTVWTWIAQQTRDEIPQGSGLHPEPFRTLNLIIHATNSVLVFWLLCLSVRATRPSLIGAILFTIHPLQVESVVWVSELRGLLAALFSLIALALYGVIANQAACGRRSRRQPPRVSSSRFLPSLQRRRCRWSPWPSIFCSVARSFLDAGGCGRWSGLSSPSR